MKNRAFFCLGLLLLAAFPVPGQTVPDGEKEPARDYTQYVNPFVGTDFHGHTFPGAVSPFGMVQLSPDTRLEGWDGCSGYHYSDTLVYGFSHTHLSGTGCSDYGDILLMPVSGYGTGPLSNDRYRSRFSHERETASPGYYAVTLDTWNVRAELTAGRRIGLHRYTFEDGAAPQIVLDLSHRDALLESSLELLDEYTVRGMRRSEAWATDQPVYFYLRFSEPVESVRYESTAVQDRRSDTTSLTRALFQFRKKNKNNTVSVKIGLSSTGTDAARDNLLAEIPETEAFPFDDVRHKTVERWNGYLGRIDAGFYTVPGDPERDSLHREILRTFYTALYHTGISPSLYSDAGSPEEYTVFSLWDTYRALHPLFSLIERERTVSFINSFLSIYDLLGKLPVWELSRNETNCMIGYHSVPVIADAVAKGITGFDIQYALDAMVASSRKPEFGIDIFREHGAVLAEYEHESVSKTLEYAFDDWCIAQTALYLKNVTGEERYDRLFREYLRSSQYYLNVFDPGTGFMRARQEGCWVSPFHPSEVNNHYTEANSWQYSFYVPHDVEGHIRLLGGDSLYCDKLDRLFTASSRTTGRHQVDITGLIGQYAQGNEPSHHAAYLYNFAGQPWKTQKRVREIMTTLYDSSPDGLCGNEDCGQMSAWYVFSAMGFYPVTPGSDQFVLGSPLFDYVTLNLESGRSFTLRTDYRDEFGPVTDFPFITSASLNDSSYTRTWISARDILAGGELRLALDEFPNTEFGIAAEDRPSSSVSRQWIEETGSREGLVTGTPWFETANRIFTGNTLVSIGSYSPDDEIWYAVHGNYGVDETSYEFERYRMPFVVSESCTVTAYAVNARGERSHTVTTSLYRIREDRSIRINAGYNPQYNAGGDRGLIDGVRGRINWRTGGWQGYQATDFEAVVDLRDTLDVSSVSAGFLQDARSWIWFPTYVEYYISDDGEHFTLLGRVYNPVDPTDYEIQTQDLTWLPAADEEIPKGRYIKVFAKNFGTIPDWHLGAGNQAFIFIDEIDIKN